MVGYNPRSSFLAYTNNRNRAVHFNAIIPIQPSPVPRCQVQPPSLYTDTSPILQNFNRQYCFLHRSPGEASAACIMLHATSRL